MAQAMLDCGQCGARKNTSLVEEQVHTLQAGSPARIFCEKCGQMTPWSYASYDRRNGEDRRLERARAAALREAVSAAAAVPLAGNVADNPYADLARSFLKDQRADSGRRGAQQRRHRRVPLELPLRVSARKNGAVLQETTRTMNVCRTGVYFQSELEYHPDLSVGVELNYSGAAPAAGNSFEQPGIVVRVDVLPRNRRRGIAVKLN